MTKSHKYPLNSRRSVILASVIVAMVSVVGASPATSQAACNNEELRGELDSSFLPNCRAYEKVTPNYKEGYGMFLRGYSTNGERIFLSSLGTLDGAIGEGEEVETAAIYEANREQSNWQLTPINPSQAEYAGQSLVSANASNGLSLWVQHTPQQSAMTQDLYLRLTGGEYRLVGPLNTPKLSVGEPSDSMELFQRTEAVAATSDYSHIILKANAEDRWPFDETTGGGHSLYEYSGTNNLQPTLVTVWGPKGSTKLIGQCGAALGSNEGSSYNAISTNGEAVFFTPTVHGEFACTAPAPSITEVWARIHGSNSSLSEAESVDISQSACTANCTPPESGSNFEGASENGETVFFTSTQKLTDDASQDTDPTDDASGSGGCAETEGEYGCNLYVYTHVDIPSQRALKLVAGHADVRGVTAIAENGSRAYFVAKQVLTTTPNIYGVSARSGAPNLYVYNVASETTTFIATLGENESDAHDWSRRFHRPVELTPDGQFLVFVSSEPGLTPGDTASTEQLFEYDAETTELVRVSQGENGFAENGNSVYAGMTGSNLEALEEISGKTGYPTDFKTTSPDPNIAENGLTIAFESNGQLSPRAISAEAGEEGCSSVYEYSASGHIESGSVYLVSDGLDDQPNKGAICGATFLAMNADATNILFSTADPLLPSDPDSVQRGIYDARVEGGFPVAREPSSCEVERCEQIAVSALPLASLPDSLTQGPEVSAPASERATKKAASKKQTGIKDKKLTKALRSCRQDHRRQSETRCEVAARRRYGSERGKIRRARDGK
jgi:hypothetical protein